MSYNREKLPKELVKKHDEARKIGKRINYLKTAIKIQDIAKEYGKTGKGYTNRWIYRNKIDVPEFDIDMSYGTFNNYLGIQSPRTELEQLDKKLKKMTEK